MLINKWDKGLSQVIESSLIDTAFGTSYNNIDNKTISLAPLKQDKELATVVDKYIYKFKEVWLSFNTYRSYVEFQNRLYYTDGINKPKKTSDGVTWYNIGIEKPIAQISTISVATPGNLTGTYQWCYTYYNINDGTESQPNEFSPEVTITAGKATFDLVASTDPQVTNIRLYRLGGNLVNMVKVIELTNTSVTYTDNIADIDVSGEALASETYKPPEVTLTNLTEHNTMLFGSVGPILYYTDIASPNYWSPFNFIELDATITGLGTTVNGLLVFTSNKTYIITGTTPSSFSRYVLSTSQGCKSAKSIQSIQTLLAWVSNDGICASNGSSIEVVSQNYLGKVNLDIKSSAIYDNEYYLALADKTIIVDYRETPIFKTIDIVTESLFYSINEDKLYYSKAGKLNEVYGNTSNRSLLFRSGKITEGSITNRKNYSNLYIYTTGTMEFKLYLNGILRHTYILNDGFNDIDIPSQYRYSYYMEYEITGINKVLEIEYKVEGRQNGK